MQNLNETLYRILNKSDLEKEEREIQKTQKKNNKKYSLY